MSELEERRLKNSKPRKEEKELLNLRKIIIKLFKNGILKIKQKMLQLNQSLNQNQPRKLKPRKTIKRARQPPIQKLQKKLLQKSTQKPQLEKQHQLKMPQRKLKNQRKPQHQLRQEKSEHMKFSLLLLSICSWLALF